MNFHTVQVSTKFLIRINFHINSINLSTHDAEQKYYQLVGVIVHQGTSATCGHYIAYVQFENGWFRLEDEKVH